MPFLKSIVIMKCLRYDKPRRPSTPDSAGKSFTIQGTFLAVLPKTVTLGIDVKGTCSIVEAVVVETRFFWSMLRPNPVVIHQGKTIKLAPVSSTNFAFNLILPSR